MVGKEPKKKVTLKKGGVKSPKKGNEREGNSTGLENEMETMED
jgi:hypothetical protein